jgi:3-hydroxyacyl-CoA dehydrogenase
LSVRGAAPSVVKGKDKVAAGELGRKSSQGFYDWE